MNFVSFLDKLLDVFPLRSHIFLQTRGRNFAHQIVFYFIARLLLLTNSEGFGYLFDPGRLFFDYWLFAVEGLA